MTDEDKILITGSNGQLGQCFRAIRGDDKRYIFTTRKDFDIGDYEKMSEFLNKNPDVKVIINCAGYTDVKGAETDEGYKKALSANVESVGNLSTICAKKDIFLVHFGTDYMFPYFENRNTPIEEDEYIVGDYSETPNKYGLSKLRGVDLLINTFSQKKNYVVIVISWLFSPFGNNFVTNLYKKINREKDTDTEFKYVCNQVGSPTYGIDLANFVSNVIEKKDCKFVDENDKDSNLINYSCYGVASWYDIAKCVESNTEWVGVMPMYSNYDKIKRPNYSVLSLKKLINKFGKDYTITRYWEDAIVHCLTYIRYIELGEWWYNDKILKNTLKKEED